MKSLLITFVFDGLLGLLVLLTCGPEQMFSTLITNMNLALD